ncbi:hypothetical protein KSP40_PGU000573 [Platanthera guangdongensis]|uniref:FAD synthase n=1 Tax=Platanthera guangdongensis TaxID=2320717 RepID=A0ABR2MF28_9ASPA
MQLGAHAPFFKIPLLHNRRSLIHRTHSAMEGVGNMLQFSNPRIPTSISSHFFLPHRFSLRGGGSPGAHGFPSKFMLADCYRSFPCWRESVLNLYNALHKSQTAAKVLSSYEPQEVDIGGKETATNKFILDCGSDQECVVGGIVALGKFDALHMGHRELAIQASKAGIPFLLCFAGIAEVLGWESRPPIVAKCDRRRVLSSWASYCGNIVPLEYHIDFSSVRHLTPQQFVERLSKELSVGGVVAGVNYRFGYKAAGDANDLVRLCKEYGLSAYIVSPVMDKTSFSTQHGASISNSSSDFGQVSSTRVREALAMRDMCYVAELLGRKHRLMLMPMNEEYHFKENTITAPKSCMLNQPPGNGEFSNCSLLVGDVCFARCRVVIDSKSIMIELECRKQAGDLVPDDRCIGIEF